MASFVDVQLVLKRKHAPPAPDFNIACRMRLRGCEISSRKRLNCEPNSHQINIEIGGAGERGPERSLKVFDYFVHLLNQTLILVLTVLRFQCHFLSHTHT